MKSAKGCIQIDTERCKGCGLCIWGCPKGGIRLSEEVDRRGIRVACPDEAVPCTGCGFCYVVCPDVAITVKKRIVGNSNGSRNR